MKTTEKAERTLSGTLMRPLAIGSGTIILHQGKFIHTSRIVAIERGNAEEVHFETLNTRYHLLTGPAPLPSVSLFPMALAA